MPNENNSTGSSDATESKQPIEPELSNRDVKGHPLFQKVAQEAAELRKFKEAQDSAEASRAQKAAEAEKDYAKATQLAVDRALKDARAVWDSEQTAKDARAEARFQLVKAGFKNDKFVKGLLSDFDPSKSSAEEFAKSAAADSENAPFLEVAGAAGKKHPSNPDPQTPPAGMQSRMTDDEIRKLRESRKPEERAAAHDAGLRQWIEDNKGKAV